MLGDSNPQHIRDREGRGKGKSRLSDAVAQQSETGASCKGEVKRYVTAIPFPELFIAENDRGFGSLN